MKPGAKTILINSIEEFKRASKDKQGMMIRHVRRNLIRDEKAVSHIGMGFAQDMVTAGKVFLRLYEPKNLK